MTNRMQKLTEFFCDVAIIETTHKSNRFNLPLMDIIVINNLGKSCTVFLSLLESQTYEPYKWALGILKHPLEKRLQ